ncbi:MAG TPA: AgmX/PglI C-terminal domain-containing protein [Bdellovibrionales bacterium]|nr:AgmX/PglI C-terminal domain-containing protein [Bdellovibrionales bacterium]
MRANGARAESTVTLELRWGGRLVSTHKFEGDRNITIGTGSRCDFIVPQAGEGHSLLRLRDGGVWLSPPSGSAGTLQTPKGARPLGEFHGVRSIFLAPPDAATLELGEITLGIRQEKLSERPRGAAAFNVRELFCLLGLILAAAIMLLWSAIYEPGNRVTRPLEPVVRRAIWKFEPAAPPGPDPTLDLPDLPRPENVRRNPPVIKKPNPGAGARVRGAESIFNSVRAMGANNRLSQTIAESARITSFARRTGGTTGFGPTVQGLRTGVPDGTKTVGLPDRPVGPRGGGGRAGAQTGTGFGLGPKASGLVTAPPSALEVTGSIDREGIRRVILAAQREIKSCYERALSTAGDLHGKIVLGWEIDDHGRVRAPRVHESTIQNAAVERCLVQVAAEWRFPPAPAGQAADVRYPFVFMSDSH